MIRRWIAVLQLAALFGLAAFAHADEPLEDLAAIVHDAAALQPMLDAPAPPGAAVDDLHAFYKDKCAAAQQLGAYGRALEIAREWYDAMPPERQIPPLYQLHDMHIKYGDRALGLKYGDELIRRDENWRGRFMSRLWVAGNYVDQYELKRARKLMDEGAAYLEQATARPRGATGQFHIARGRGMLARLQARFAMLGGKYQDAERLTLSALAQVEDAARRSRALDKRFQHAVANQYVGAVGTLVKVLRVQGRYFDAESRLADAVEYLRRENWLAGQYPGLVRTAAALRLSRHRYADALALAQRSVRAYELAGAARGSQSVASEEMRIAALIGLGNWSEARQAYRTLEQRLEAAPEQRRLLSGMQRGVVRLMSQEYADAKQLLGPILEARRERLGQGHALTAQTAGLYGIALWRLAQRSADEAAMEDARRLVAQSAQDIADSEGLQGGLSTADLGEVYRRLILEARLEMLHPAMAGGQGAAIDEGFRIADALRRSSVQEAIVEAAIRASAAVPGLAELVRAIQDRERELDVLYDYLLDQTRGSLSGNESPELATLRERLRALQDDLRARLMELRTRYPDFDRLTGPKPPDTASVARQLRPGEAMLSMLPTSTRTWLWLVTGEGTSFATSDRGEPQIARWVGDLRRTLDVAAMATPPAPDFEAAHELYRALIAPLRGHAGARREWILVGGGVLGQLPFATLLTRPGRPVRLVDAHWLVRELAVSAAPSAAAWMALRRLGPHNQGKSPLAAFGDPAFDGAAPGGTPASVRNLNVARRNRLGIEASAAEMPALPAASGVQHGDIPPLPETREEVLAIARVLEADPQRDVFLGRQASRRNVLQLNASGQLAKRRVVVFATHGLVAGDLPRLDQPALALAYGDGEGADWLLTLQDVLGLKLDAEWVVLSACNTAAADGEGGEALSGLGRGFFYAGARAMLLTHWAVESRSARALTTGLFAAYGSAPISRAEALRTSQLALIATPATAHPTYWGAFALVGDGGR